MGLNLHRWYAALIAVALVAGSAVAAAEPPQRLTAATRQSAPPVAEPAREVKLPDAWNRTGLAGTWVYRLAFRVGAEPSVDWGLYVPRLGNRARLSVNGVAIGHLGDLGDLRQDHAQRPHFFVIPRSALRVGENTLEVMVQGERARYAGLSDLLVGPASEVRRPFFWRELAQTWGSFAVVAISMLLALVALPFAQMTRDRAWMWFGLAGLFTAVRTSYALVTTPPLDWRWWSLVTDVCYAAYLGALALFILEVLGLRARWLRLGAGAMLLLSAVLLPWYAFGREIAARQYWTMAMLVYALALCAFVIQAWWRRLPHARPLGIAGTVAVAMGLHDHVMAFYSDGGFGAFALARYSLPLFLLAMGAVLFERYRDQQRQAQAVRQQLQDELQTRTRTLVEQFEHQKRQIESAAHARERGRMVQDLHDGLGLQLNALLALAEERGHGADELGLEVRNTIEQVRLLVDQQMPFDGGWLELLGHIRHRVQSRLRPTGLTLDWQQDPALPDGPVAPVAAAALQHLFFEATTNVLRHAQARQLTVRIRRAADASTERVALTIRDDGIGFDPEQVRGGVGLRSLRQRADVLGGTLQCRARAGEGVELSVEFPSPAAA